MNFRFYIDYYNIADIFLQDFSEKIYFSYGKSGLRS